MATTMIENEMTVERDSNDRKQYTSLGDIAGTVVKLATEARYVAKGYSSVSEPEYTRRAMVIALLDGVRNFLKPIDLNAFEVETQS